MTPLSILKHFNFRIILSTCTLDVATLLVAVEACDDTFLLDMTGGAIRTAPLRAKKSRMLNPLSAITISPGST